MQTKGGYVYIMSSIDKTTLYVGVTSNLEKRIWEHQNKFYLSSFTAKYNCILLVYYQFFDSVEAAIAEEKRIKGESRTKKVKLIEGMNSFWNDLSNEIE